METPESRWPSVSQGHTSTEKGCDMGMRFNVIQYFSDDGRFYIESSVLFSLFIQ